MSTATHWKSSQLDALIAGDLSASEREQLELHLENCTQCQAALQDHAATESVWEQTREYLSDDDDDRRKFVEPSIGNVTCSHTEKELLAALKPTDDPRMLGRLGPYEIAGVIGSGGMGVVLKAFDPALSRFVAMKVLSPALWKDEQARERFSREARAAASVVHENVIEIYSVDEAGGIPYFTMPYLRGETLKQRIDHRGPLSIEESLRISKQLADALSAAHDQGLVHRDIKPSNILLSGGSERVHLSDFGLAHQDTDDHLTFTGAITGTPGFMSPEQIQGTTTDHRSDLFSLGSVMYTMAAGKEPFEAETVMQKLMRVTEGKPLALEEINPTVPMWFAAIVNRLHAADPMKRYQSASELSCDLQPCLASVQNPESCIQPRSILKLEQRYRKQRKRKRQLLPMLAGAILTAVLLAGVVGPTLFGNMMANGQGQPIDITGKVVDQDGKPIADCNVIAVQKLWPNGRYQQRSLKTKTNKKGKFRFESFATQGKQYAYLLTALSKSHTMVSEYKFVQDGAQVDQVTLRAEANTALDFKILDSSGAVLNGAQVLPFNRTTADGDEYMSYAFQMKDGGSMVADDGSVQLAAFKRGEKVELIVDSRHGISEHKLLIPKSGSVLVTVQEPKPTTSKPAKLSGKVVDPKGKPVAGAKVIFIHKSWPNNRFQMRSYHSKTDKNGSFSMEKTYNSEIQNAFLVTVLADGFAMKSHYEVIKPKTIVESVKFKLQPATPITFQFRDEQGKPVRKASVTINSRKSGKDEHLIYPASASAATWKTDEAGKLRLTFFKPKDEVQFVVQSAKNRMKVKVAVEENAAQDVRVSTSR